MNHDLEPVIMAVLKVFPLLGDFHFRKRHICPVLFDQVSAILTVFIAKRVR